MVGEAFVELGNFTLRSFAGEGLVLQDASSVLVVGVRVDDCGQNGIHLSGDSVSNILESVSAVDCDEHGVWFDGPGAAIACSATASA